jgi:hypothetical protein
VGGKGKGFGFKGEGKGKGPPDTSHTQCKTAGSRFIILLREIPKLLAIFVFARLLEKSYF